MFFGMSKTLFSGDLERFHFALPSQGQIPLLLAEDTKRQVSCYWNHFQFGVPVKIGRPALRQAEKLGNERHPLFSHSVKNSLGRELEKAPDRGLCHH